VTRNALASPDLLGVTAGAGFVAVILVLVIPDAPRALLPFAALAGGAASGTIVYLIAWKQGVSPERLALTGIAVTAIFQAAVTAVVTLSVENNNVQLALQWLTGSLYGRGWEDLWLLLPWSVAGITVALVVAHKVNLLLLGDHVAAGLGMRIEQARMTLVGIAVMLAASAVSITGTVAFIGLVIPHLVRLLIGADHRLVLPVSAIAGAILLLVADDIARTVVPSLEIPAGLLTALIGAPYFIYLITRSKTRISV
jgi:iron complex transport system permease protein